MDFFFLRNKLQSKIGLSVIEENGVNIVTDQCDHRDHYNADFGVIFFIMNRNFGSIVDLTFHLRQITSINNKEIGKNAIQSHTGEKTRKRKKK